MGRIVMRYDYDMLGTKIHQASMEAGERWMLNDVMGKPIRAWDSRGHLFRTEYDPLRRPVRSFVQGADPQNPANEILFARTDYGEGQPNDTQRNLRTRPFRQHDGTGVMTNEKYDFKGNLLSSTRQLAQDYKSAPDWSASPALEPETFTSATTYDALNRAVTVTAPDNSICRPAFNEANLLDKVDVNLRGAATATSFVTNVDYNAKGQRTLIQYKNGAATSYDYDDKTFRLTHVKTTRAAGLNGLAAQIFVNAATVQDLNYTYDPAGNITRIKDAALKTVFNGQKVDPVCEYTYDPLYRLIEATGREHIGQSALPFMPPDGNYRDYPFVGASQLNNLQALRNYTERYDYDAVGNFNTMAHLAGNGAGNWTRTYAYNESSLIEPAKRSNRLSETSLQTNAGANSELYSYDAHGNITQMPHLPLMQWNFKDEMSASSRQVVNAGAPEMTYYVCDAAGQRVRKVTERQNGARKNERLYLGGYEVYREFAVGGSVTLERETLHIMDAKQRIALIETQTIASGAPIASPIPAQRYQFGNHLGSASLELDETGQLISYEEYSPYGSTTYQAGRSAAEVSLKRYRYTDKERDEENGFTYHGARYYAPWLGRWTSYDPAGLVDGLCLYEFVRGNPISHHDPTGMQGVGPTSPTLQVGYPSLADRIHLTPQLSSKPIKTPLKATTEAEPPSLAEECAQVCSEKLHDVMAFHDDPNDPEHVTFLSHEELQQALHQTYGALGNPDLSPERLRSLATIADIQKGELYLASLPPTTSDKGLGVAALGVELSPVGSVIDIVEGVKEGKPGQIALGVATLIPIAKLLQLAKLAKAGMAAAKVAKAEKVAATISKLPGIEKSTLVWAAYDAMLEARKAGLVLDVALATDREIAASKVYLRVFEETGDIGKAGKAARDALGASKSGADRFFFGAVNEVKTRNPFGKVNAESMKRAMEQAKRYAAQGGSALLPTVTIFEIGSGNKYVLSLPKAGLF